MINLTKLIVFTSILYLISAQFLAQSSKIDSLEKVLAGHPDIDFERVDILHDLAHHYRGYDIHIAEEKCQEAFELATQLNYASGLAKNSLIQSKIHLSKSEFSDAQDDAHKSLDLYKKINKVEIDEIIAVYNTLGMLGNYQNNADTALFYFKKGMLAAKKNKSLLGEGNMLNNIGITFYLRGEMDSALVYYQQSIKIDEQLKDDDRLTSSLHNIAVIYSIQGRYSEALDINFEILEMRIKSNNKSKIAGSYQNIGVLYSEREQYEKALDYHIDALKIYEELEDMLSTAVALNSIGSTLIKLKNYEKGVEYLNKALVLNTEINNNTALIVNHNSLGKIRILQNEYQEALDHFNASYELSLAIDDKRNIGISHVNLAEVYFLLNNYTTALDHALKGKQIVDDLEMLSEQVTINGILSDIYEKTGNYKEAFECHKQYKVLNDSLFNKENIEKFTQLEYEYKYKGELETAKDKEIKLIETVKVTNSNLAKTQRNLLLGIILFLSVTVLLGGIIFYLRFKNIKERTQNIITEQKLLRSQMTPHFIFNALSVLQGMILNKEEKRAVSYLSKFSKLLRLTLENSREQMVSLDQELLAIENYLELHNIESSSPLNYTIEVNSSINKEQFKIPPMLIQPFIENAIEHGFINHEEQKQIDIKLIFSNQELTCTIQDNGIGVNTQREPKNQQKKSLSTTITKERLELLSKNTKCIGSVQIEDRKKYGAQGTLITMVIPYNIDATKSSF
ncbi:MAG: tetratricopeptide repeat protein [Flavobacteriales bacterium]|nr:tetratricopeptide repeat protein [Flavobacteriales bacterium]